MSRLRDLSSVLEGGGMVLRHMLADVRVALQHRRMTLQPPQLGSMFTSPYASSADQHHDSSSAEHVVDIPVTSSSDVDVGGSSSFLPSVQMAHAEIVVHEEALPPEPFHPVPEAIIPVDASIIPTTSILSTSSSSATFSPTTASSTTSAFTNGASTGSSSSHSTIHVVHKSAKPLEKVTSIDQASIKLVKEEKEAKWTTTADEIIMKGEQGLSEFEKNQGILGRQSPFHAHSDSSEPLVPHPKKPVVKRDVSHLIPETPKPKFQERAVPSSSFSRFLGFSGLATRMAFGAVSSMVSNVVGKPTTSPSSSTNESPSSFSSADTSSNLYGDAAAQSGSSDKLFTNVLSEQNAERLAATLCRMRGAALKLGQIISIQDESVIPPQVQKILDRVRQQADIMPKKQLYSQLEKELGADWQSKFQSFEETPIAAASIGQVHKAVAADGTVVAVKVQYPGVADSIDSDLNNLKRLLMFTNILPRGLYVDSAISVARKELTQECDYRYERESQVRMRELLADDPRNFYVPRVIDDLCTQRVFTSEFVSGFPVDKVIHLDQETRNAVALRLLTLCLRELFEFRFMQTDPNWSNFFYDSEHDRMNLIDFGACREYPKSFVDEYLRVVYHAAQRDYQGVIESSRKLGFLTGDESETMNKAHADAVMIVGEPFSVDGPYDFRHHQATRRINKLVPTMLEGRLTPPPMETYSLHRKLSGAFLTCFRLGAVIPCRDVFMEMYRKYKFDE